MKLSSAITLLLFTTLILTPQSALAQEDIEFDYSSGENGLQKWGEHFPVCNGEKQSPIDIPEDEFPVNRLRLEEPRFGDAKNVRVFHNGHTIQVESSDEDEPLPVRMKINGKNFQLEQMHFHVPSEHHIAGVYFDVEGHLVFASTGEEPKARAVVGALFMLGGKRNHFLKPITDHVPQEKGEQHIIKELRFSQLLRMLDNLEEVYNYEGSLTTPPCTEGIQWFISRKVQPINITQLLRLRSAIGFNARPVQFRESFD